MLVASCADAFPKIWQMINTTGNEYLLPVKHGVKKLSCAKGVQV